MIKISQVVVKKVKGATVSHGEEEVETGCACIQISKQHPVKSKIEQGHYQQPNILKHFGFVTYGQQIMSLIKLDYYLSPNGSRRADLPRIFFLNHVELLIPLFERSALLEKTHSWHSPQRDSQPRLSILGNTALISAIT